jgi:hypothetical protein
MGGNFEFPEFITIEDYLEQIGVSGMGFQNILEWWGIHAKGISIHYLDFYTDDPISAIYLEEGKIAINRKVKNKPEFNLFLLLHELNHRNHEVSGDIQKYFNLVLSFEKEKFTDLHFRLEKESNDFAIRSMSQIGFQFTESEEKIIRRNQICGDFTYEMIRKENKGNFKEILYRQVLGM